MVNRSKKDYILVCPKCKSTDVGTDYSNPLTVMTGFSFNSRICNACGYSANYFPEVEIGKKGFKKLADKKRKQIKHCRSARAK